MNKAYLALAPILLSAACFVDSVPAETEHTDQQRSAIAGLGSFDVDFSQCTEMASLAPVPVANVRALVPPQFTLANESSGTTFIVVRVATCADSTVDGKADGAGTLAQIGANLESPDGSGDIDNYTLWYYATSARLAAKLNGSGVRAQHVGGITFAATPTSTPGIAHLAINVPGHPAFSAEGDVGGELFTTNYQAGWWGVRRARGARGKGVVMNTDFPTIQFNGAAMTLTTSPSNDLGQILGSGSVMFPIFDSYNSFPAAHMVVTKSR